MSRPIVYDQNYRKKCFDSWFLAGRPEHPAKIIEVIPVYAPTGKKPSVAHIKRFMVDGAWDEWADTLDAKALAKADTALVNKKAQMLIRHQESAGKIAEKAEEHLLKEGFDSSNAAVSAYFKATEEQRKVAGFSDLLERLDKMTNNEVELEIMSKLKRIQDNDQIIEVESEDVGEDSDEEKSPD